METNNRDINKNYPLYIKSAQFIMTAMIHFMMSEGLNLSMNAVEPAKHA